MNKLKKENFGIKDLILIIVLILLILINLILYVKKFVQPQEDSVLYYESTNTVLQKEEKVEYNVSTTEAELIKELSQMTERDRIEYYCGKYLKYLDEKDYESAYNLLYTDFKNTYFPTYEDFVQYVEKTYPEHLAVEYDDISRQGTIYVLRLKLLDLSGNKDDEEVIQRIVIQENNYNDFVISFQVI